MTPTCLAFPITVKISKPELLNNYRDFDPDFVIATDFGCGFFSSDLGTFLELIAKETRSHI